EKYFWTQERWDEFLKVQSPKPQVSSPKPPVPSPMSGNSIPAPVIINSMHGTVGAVALDKYGNLAAGTSTGGMTNKKYGRVGDSPIIGAGTYANNNTCAVSGTGWGEFFIRLVMAKSISDMMEFGKYSLKDAADE